MDGIAAFQTARPEISLYRLLNEGFLEGRFLFPEKHKLILAFNLAQSLLQFYSTPWVQNDWTAESLLFMYEADTDRVLNIHQPYTTCSLSSRTHESNNNDTPHNHKPDEYPFILSFGKLLLEIIEGKVIDGTEVGNSNPRRALWDRFDQWRKQEQLSKDYVKAIESCLRFPILLHRVNDSDVLAKCRDIIQTDIVEPLGREVDRYENVVIGLKNLDLAKRLRCEAIAQQAQDIRPKTEPSPIYGVNCVARVPKVPFSVLKFSDLSIGHAEDKSVPYAMRLSI